MRYEALGKLIHIKHGYAFKSEYFSLHTGTQVVLTPGNFYEEGGFKLRPDKDRFYTGNFPKEFVLKKNDLIIAMTEQTYGLLGSPALIPADDRYLHNQRLGKFELLDRKRACLRYLYHLFCLKSLRDEISVSATGTKIRHTAPERIYKLKVPLPPLPIQRKIAAVLSAYDDLIENNNCRIAILEKMAEELYREWFVRLRFPGHEKVRIVKGVPEGWEVKRVKDIGKVVTGKTPSTAIQKYHNGNVMFIKTPDMHNNMFVFKTEETLTEEGMNSQSSQTLPVNSICVSCIGTGGIVAITTSKCQTNQQINSVIPESEEYVEWAYFTLVNLKDTIRLFGSTGTTMTNLSKGKFADLKIYLPSSHLIKDFHVRISPIFKEIKHLSKIQQGLKDSRDRLLSRLMSGKIDVERLDIKFPASMMEEGNA